MNHLCHTFNFPFLFNIKKNLVMLGFGQLFVWLMVLGTHQEPRTMEPSILQICKMGDYFFFRGKWVIDM